MSKKIRDLQPNMNNITVIALVVSKSPVTEFKMKKYAHAIVGDDTGQIKLNLWRDQVFQVEAGDLVKIPNAFVHIRMGEKQISTWSNIEKARLEEFIPEPRT